MPKTILVRLSLDVSLQRVRTRIEGWTETRDGF